MVQATMVKLVMSPGELTIRIEKRWITRHSLVQQVDYLHQIRYLAAKRCPQKNIIGSGIKIKSNEIAGRPALNGRFLSGRDFGVKLLSDFLRNLALDRKQVVQIAIVLFRPDVRVGARVDQLRVHVKPGADSPNAALQNMRHSQFVTDLPNILPAAIAHHAGPADDFEIGDPRQLG